MPCARRTGEGALLESTLLALGPVNVARARHDLRTLAGLLPTGVEEPLEQLRALGDQVAASFTTPAPDAAPDAAHLDVGRALLERHGDELVVAALVAAVGQGVGWDVAVVASERRALVGHRGCGGPLALSIAHEGRMLDANDLREGPDLRWRCPREVAALIADRAT
ncbi:MAG: hypothetical protein JST08_07715 [Actinobacteria bacterium]|nr:hypothetical protein [Actinomycetota bacterium]